jgi:hypothetical protein
MLEEIDSTRQAISRAVPREVFEAAPLLAREHCYRPHVTLRIPCGDAYGVHWHLQQTGRQPQDEEETYGDGAMVRDDGKHRTHRLYHHRIPFVSGTAARWSAEAETDPGKLRTSAEGFPQTTAALSSV